MNALQITDHLVAKLSEPSRNISLSPTFFSNISAFIRDQGYFGLQHVAQLTQALYNARTNLKKILSTQLLIVLVSIFRRCPESLDTERGLSILIDILDDEDQAATATQASTIVGTFSSLSGSSQRTRKGRIGQRVLKDILLYYLDMQRGVTKRRQIGLLILELIHECEANQALFVSEESAGISFFKLLRDEEHDVLRVITALILRELAISQNDLTDFCHDHGSGPEMPPELAKAFKTVSTDEIQLSERLSWAMNFLNRIAPILENQLSRPPLHIVRGIFCDFLDTDPAKGRTGLDITHEEGQGLVMCSGISATIMVLRNDDAVPFLVDVPRDTMSKIEKIVDIKTQRNGVTIRFKHTQMDTVFLDGEGHRTGVLTLLESRSTPALSSSIEFLKTASQSPSKGSQALSPANVSAASHKPKVVLARRAKKRPLGSEAVFEVPACDNESQQKVEKKGQPSGKDRAARKSKASHRKASTAGTQPAARINDRSTPPHASKKPSTHPSTVRPVRSTETQAPGITCPILPEKANVNIVASGHDATADPLASKGRTSLPVQQVAPESLGPAQDDENSNTQDGKDRSNDMAPPSLPTHDVRTPQQHCQARSVVSAVFASKQPKSVTRRSPNNGMALGANTAGNELVKSTPRGRLAANMQPPGSHRATKIGVASFGSNIQRQMADSLPTKTNPRQISPPHYTLSLSAKLDSPTAISTTAIRPSANSKFGSEASNSLNLLSDNDGVADQSDAEIEADPTNATQFARDEHQDTLKEPDAPSGNSAMSQYTHLQTPLGQRMDPDFIITDDRLVRKPKLICFDEAGPRNRGIGSAVQRANRATESHRRINPLPDVDLHPDNIVQSPRLADRQDDADPERVIHQAELPEPSHTLSATQITDAGSPMRSQGKAKDYGGEDAFGQDAFEFALTVPTMSPGQAQDVGELRDRGRRISEQPHLEPPSRPIKSRTSGAQQARSGNSPLSNATPHKMRHQGYTNMRTEHVIVPSIPHDPFVDGKSAASLHPKQTASAVRTIPSQTYSWPPEDVRNATLNKTSVQQIKFVTTEQSAQRDNIAKERGPPVVQDSQAQSISSMSSVKGDWLHDSADTRLQETTFHTLDESHVHVPMHTVHMSLQSTRAGAGKRTKPGILKVPQKLVPERLRSRGRQSEQITRPHGSTLDVPADKVNLRSGHGAGGKSSRSTKRPRAFQEDEDSEPALNPRKETRRSKRVRFPSDPDGSSSDSASSRSHSDSERSNDFDRATIEPGSDDKTSPLAELQQAFMRMAEIQVRPFASISGQAACLIRQFEEKATSKFSQVLETQQAVRCDFDSNVSKSKKRLLDEIQVQYDTLSADDGKLKKRRIDARITDAPDAWNTAVDDLKLAGNACLRAFA